ncbi:type II secretion system F family protein [Methanobrevibacter sp.]|uniref:type II secretion system F family protein n=1 Tax=Methanobrevibacter sp. TaxID=66852 RepID=UPI00388F37BD
MAISIIDFFKNIKSNKEFENDNENILGILQKLNFEIDVKNSKKEESQLDRVRNILLKYMLTRQLIGMILIVSALLAILTDLEIFGIFLTIMIMLYIFILYYPSIKEERNYSDINQELPYALRHMGIELKSGKGLHDALITISNADYGSLSKEFKRVLEEVKFGKPTEDSLLEMSHRVESEGLSRAIQQIIGTLRIGGNLSESLNIIAKDITFDMQIKLKEYSQRLNSFILIYTFVAILTPVIGLIMLMAGSTVMGDIIPSNLLLMIYSVFFPMMVVFMGVFMKKLEPKI